MSSPTDLGAHQGRPRSGRPSVSSTPPRRSIGDGAAPSAAHTRSPRHGAATPAGEETYLKFGWDELGGQLGVTAAELVGALHQHAQTIEYDLEVPGSPRMSRAPSAMSRATSGLMSRARSGLSALAAPFTGTPQRAPSEHSEHTHQATGFIVLVPAVAEEGPAAAGGRAQPPRRGDTTLNRLLARSGADQSPLAPSGLSGRLFRGDHGNLGAPGVLPQGATAGVQGMRASQLLLGDC